MSNAEFVQRLREQQALTILEGLDQHLVGAVEFTLSRDRHGIVVIRESHSGKFVQQNRGVSIADASAQYLQSQKAPETLSSRDTLPAPPIEPLDTPSDAPTAPSSSQSPPR